MTYGQIEAVTIFHSALAFSLNFRSVDHLGRPQFATNADGAVIWDIGAEVIPFGDAVNFASAFAQRLMFPGQYANAETGEDIVLSHNWHRTYDPTLGRYLQSDPIGLAGGLNRYAYVGGNPVSFVDPMGLGYVRPGEEGHGTLVPLRGSNVTWMVLDLSTDIDNPSFTGNPVECRCGSVPKPNDDVDFFLRDNKWHKILTGNVTVTSNGIFSNPKRVFRLKGSVSIPAVFPAHQPPSLYSANQLPEYIFLNKQSPAEYLRSIKKTVPSCANIPLP